MPSRGYQAPRPPSPGLAPGQGRPHRSSMSQGVDDMTRKMSKVGFNEGGQRVGTSSSRPPPPQAGRRWDTLHSAQGSGRRPSQAPQRPAQAPSQANMSKISYDMADAFKQWGVQIMGAITNVTSTSVQHFQPKNWKMKANTDPRDYKLGDIILGPWIVPCLDAQAIKDKDPKQFASFTRAAETGPIIAKCRPMIVYAIFKDHLLVYPVFSSGGQGVFWKSGEVKNRSIPLYEEDYIVDRKHGDYYFRAEMGYGSKQGSYIDMTMPYNVSLGAPILRLGKLTQHSFRRFHSLHTEFLRRGQKPVESQTSSRPQIPQADSRGQPLASPPLKPLK